MIHSAAHTQTSHLMLIKCSPASVLTYTIMQAQCGLEIQVYPYVNCDEHQSEGYIMQRNTTVSYRIAGNFDEVFNLVI